jgi:hypothetical protein
MLLLTSTMGTTAWQRGYRRWDGSAELLGCYCFSLSAAYRGSGTVDDAGKYGLGLLVWQHRSRGMGCDSTGKSVPFYAGRKLGPDGGSYGLAGTHVTRPVGGVNFREVGPLPFIVDTPCQSVLGRLSGT